MRRLYAALVILGATAFLACPLSDDAKRAMCKAEPTLTICTCDLMQREDCCYSQAHGGGWRPCPSPSPAASPSPSAQPSPSPSPLQAPSPTPAPTATPTPAPSPAPEPSATPTPAPSASPCVEEPLPGTPLPVLPFPCAKGYVEAAGGCVLRSSCARPEQECVVDGIRCLTCDWKAAYNAAHGEWRYNSRAKLYERVGEAEWYDAACRRVVKGKVLNDWTYDDICAPAPRCSPIPSPTPTPGPQPSPSGESNCNGDYTPASCAPFDHVEIIGGPGPLTSADFKCSGQGTEAKPYVCPFEHKITMNSSPKVADALCQRGAVIPGVCVVPGSPVCGVPQWSTDGGQIAGEPEACGYLGHWKPPGPGAYTVTVCMPPAGCKTAHVEVR